MNTKPILLTVPAFEDFRGYLAVPYDQSINFPVRQINQGYSRKAFTLRGLHRPKALGDIRGVTYIFGMFYRFGLIDVPDEVKEKMKHPKQNTGKQ